MKALAQRRGDATADLLTGRVLCHDVRDAAGKVGLPKGTLLDATSARTLLSLPWNEVHLLVVDPGDLHEGTRGGAWRAPPPATASRSRATPAGSGR
jgi:hypothetical protein